jgi:hypothetical protein
MRDGIAALTLLAAGCAATAAHEAPLDAAALQTYPDAAGMPADVQHYIVRWSDCSHWLGEPAFDADRDRQIDRAVREVCPGVDALGQRVRARHAGSAAVLARIADYEPLGH